jgi:hypothetical protein
MEQEGTDSGSFHIKWVAGCHNISVRH